MDIKQKQNAKLQNRIGQNRSLLVLHGDLVTILLLLIVSSSILVLLVLGHKIGHVALGLGELHLVHTLAGVPMQESLATEHGRELGADPLEELLDRSAVSDEGRRHLEVPRGNRAQGGLHVVRNPLDEVGRVLVLDVAHLVLNLLHRHLTTEDGRAGQVATGPEVGSSHHVSGSEHLLGELGHGDGPERVGAAAGERSKADDEEVETGEGDHVDGELAQVRVELTGEAEAGGDTGHDGRHEVVEVAVRRARQLEGVLADVVESLARC